MEIWRKYNTAATVYFPLVTRDAADLTTGATFASGDVKIIKDGGAAANTSNLPAHEGNGIYSLALTSTEMQAACIQVVVVDQTATKVWEDTAILINTYGNASAQHAFDLSVATQSVSVTQWNGSNVATPDTAGYPKVTIKSGTGTGEVSLSSGLVRLSAAGVDDIWDEAQSGHTTAGTFGRYLDSQLATIAGYIDTEVAAIKAKTDNLPASPAATSDIPSAATIADAVWDEAFSGHTSAGSFGKLTQDVAGYIDTEVAAIKAKTDNLPASPAATGDIPSAAAIADAVWDEATSGHTTGGSFGKLATDTSGYIDTEVAAIKAKTDNLPSDPADASVIAGRFDTLDTNLATVDTVVDAIQAKTDNLPSDPADASVIAGRFDTLDTAIGALHNFDPDNDSVDIGKINGSSAAALNLSMGALSVIPGLTTDDSVGTLTFTTNLDLTLTLADQVKGRVIIFLPGGANAYVARQIAAYDESTGSITVDTALPETTVDALAFIIV